MRNWARLTWSFGAVTALISTMLPWWEAAGSASDGRLIYAAHSAASLFVILLALGGLLAFAGFWKARARRYGAGLVLAGTILGFADIARTLSRIGFFGSICDMGICVGWQLSWGFYLAAIASAMMLISLKSRAFGTTPYYAGRTSFKMPHMQVPSVGRMKHYHITVGRRKFGLIVTVLVNLVVGLFTLTPVISYGLVYAESYYFLIFGILSIAFAWALWKHSKLAPRISLVIIALLLVYLVTNIMYANVLEGIPLVILFEGACYFYARRRI